MGRNCCVDYIYNKDPAGNERVIVWFRDFTSGKAYYRTYKTRAAAYAAATKFLNKINQ